MEITRPLSTSRSETRTSFSASSHRKSGMLLDEIDARSWNSVRTHPGMRAVTVTPVPCSSLARLSV